MRVIKWCFSCAVWENAGNCRNWGDDVVRQTYPTYELFKDVPAALPEECVSLKEALQAHTINAAYQAHLEDITGSIEVGKSAELAVLDSDIEAIPVEEIQDIIVLETVFMGKTVFKKSLIDKLIKIFTIYCFSAPLSGIITVTTVPLSSHGVMVRLPPHMRLSL